MAEKGGLRMARADGIEVKVDIHMTVSDEMADRCLKLLEWWQNDHAEQNITIIQGADGSVHLYREQNNKHNRATDDKAGERAVLDGRARNYF